MRISASILRTVLLAAVIWGVHPTGAVAGRSPAGHALANALSPAVLFVDEDADHGDSADEVRYSSRDLRVQVWHDKDDDAVYKRGEELHLFFRTNEDAYVVLYYIDADGYTEVLWPTSRYDDGFVFGGHTYSIPGRGSEEGMWVGESRGVEYAEAIASKYPFDLRELALDFRFDPEETGEYAHRVSGDPFLAVNDINYAITGLEEDVDWVVTDWTHIYVDQKVEYPRYTCAQCHDSGNEKYEPYASTCTRVEIYSDWGWYSSWYVRFGYYPLYCDAPYYYWDPWYSRPYYFTYYPVVYTWPAYPVYVRPYPLYPWSGSGAYRGDYITLYERGEVHDRPLYNLSRAREISKSRDRGISRRPPSIAPRGSSRGGGKVRPDQLTRNSLPRRSREALAEGSRVRPPRTGIRTDRNRAHRTVRSLHPDRPREGDKNLRPGSRRSREGADGGSVRPRESRKSHPSRGGRTTSHGRRWTRPVVRNAPDGHGRTPAGSGRSLKPSSRTPRSSSGSRDRTGQNHVKPRRAPDGASHGGGRVRPPKRSGSGNSGGGKIRPSTRSGSRGSSRGGGHVSRPSRSASRGSSAGSGHRVAPAPRRSAPRPSAPARGRSAGGSRIRGGRG